MKPLALLLPACFILALAGCAGKRPPAPPPPQNLPPAVWQRIDQDIIEASAAAAGSANDYARRSMRVWKEQVQQRTENDFIPWFTGYWTQQWLTLKVAWYKINNGNGNEPPEKRLGLYLQEQYHQRVIDPVAEQINPEGIRDRASELYLQLLGQQLPAIIQRYNAPPEQFSQRLNHIPAIALGPPDARNATLYQLLRAKSLEQQPAWQSLRQQLHQQASKAPGQTDARLSSVATQASEKLGASLAPRGAASAIAAAVGKAAGAMISVVVTGYGMLSHDREQPQMIEQLRVILNVALNEEWQELMENRQSGAMAGVYYLSGQVEDSLLANRVPVQEQQQAPLLIRLPP
ncbi:MULTISPECIES: hypothetical protein [Pseudomonas]|uniref:Lipoprotein n=1 Tax=Pseudomonas entomophila TaxID=312306 RepID=A0A3Q8U0V1_9PSED|nr:MULTISPECIES: hypothetical protein [Pseudomonas]AZL68022.1 hypothetical protein EJA05_09845 [Pseudomonas oryziphila]MDZ4017325.1 hypothetical protein [Pseudomonas sichuanensis]UVL91120.1 hypothetical protein LOY51_09655 [Pseudomonas sichuanensis]